MRLPPGLLKLATSPIAIGSAPISKTIGIVVVADFAARAAGAPPGATITATRRPTRSAASAGNLSCCPSAQRNSIATFRPSTYPVSPRPWWKALTRLANAAGDSAPRYPITGIAVCCARAASGHATVAPPRRVMKSRRLILALMLRTGHRRNLTYSLEGVRLWRCPLWSKSRQKRIRLSCPLCANSGRCTASIDQCVRPQQKLFWNREA